MVTVKCKETVNKKPEEAGLNMKNGPMLHELWFDNRKTSLASFKVGTGRFAATNTFYGKDMT